MVGRRAGWWRAFTIHDGDTVGTGMHGAGIHGLIEGDTGMEGKSRTTGSLALLAVLILGTTGCAKLKARDLLNRGVQAYKAGQFDQAIEDFKKSKDLDPSLMNARLYLATAYATTYIPGAPSDENVRLGNQAIEEFKEVLQADPKNISAIDGIGSMLFQMGGTPFDPKKFEESKSYHNQHIQIKPQDPEPHYWIGVIDWSLAYRGNKEMRQEFNGNARKKVGDADAMPPALRDQFTAKYGATIDEGIASLKTAIENRPDYDDAMAYLNLLYRQKADTEANQAARESDVKLADELVDKVKEIKQKRMEAPPPPPQP
jgi:tetratricopeptide (TPR) repeat protein